MISPPLFEFLICSSSFIATPILGLVGWIISYIFFGYIWFRLFVLKPKYTNVRKFRLSMKANFSSVLDDRYIGNMWFTKQSQWQITIISLIVIAIGFIRACYLGESAELTLSGAFVTIAGLISAWIGLLEAARIERSWGNLISSFAEEENDLYIKIKKLAHSKTKAAQSVSTVSLTLLLQRKKTILVEKMQKPLSDAQKRAGLYSLIISIIGTLICTYGSQLPVKDIAEHFQINLSKVNCDCRKSQFNLTNS